MNFRLRQSIIPLTAAALFGAMLPNTVFAESKAVISGAQTSFGEIRINGKAGVSEIADYVIQVYAPGKNESDLSRTQDADNAGVLVWQNQSETDENGSFSVQFKLDEAVYTTGEYPVFVSIGSLGERIDTSVYFAASDDVKKAIEALNAEAEKENGDVARYIEENRTLLSFFKGEINAGDQEIARLVQNEIKRAKYSSDDMESSRGRYLQACLFAALNQKSIQNAFSYDELLLDCAEKLKPYLSKGGMLSSADAQERMTSRASGKSIIDVPTAQKALYEAAALEICKNPNGVANARSFFENLKTELGVDVSSLSDSKLNAILGKDYSSIDAFKTAISDAGKSSNGSGGSSSSSSSSKSSGGGNYSANLVPSGSITPEQAEKIPEDVYVDLKDALWARNAIVSLTDRGILSGRGADTFEPNALVLREEFVKMVVDAFEVDGKDGNVSFADADINAWYYPFLAAAEKSGIIKGIDETNFGVGRNISRQDLAAILYRIRYNGEEPEEQSGRFSDEDQISDYARAAVFLLAEKNIISGMEDGSFCPDAPATRAQAAMMIYKILN